MKIQILFLLVLSSSKAQTSTSLESQHETNCSIRFQDNGACACYSNQHDGVSCNDDNSISIKPCYYDSATNSTYVAKCYYACYQYRTTTIKVNSSTDFNTQMCGRFKDLHRTGNFCTECEINRSLAAYSYRMLECVPCEDYGYKNWLQYFAITLLPLTVFYIAALIFDFNVTSSRFNIIVLVIQVLMSPVLVDFMLPKHVLSKTFNKYTPTQFIAMKTAISIGAILNMDFFRMLYKPFCLNPNLNVIEILCLHRSTVYVPTHLPHICVSDTV